MAHELTIRANGMAEMAWVGERPWHGLGAELAPGASMAEWRTASGLDWQIQRSNEFFYYNGTLIDNPGNVVLHRSDNGFRLGNVSDSFKEVQPAEVLDFFADLCSTHGLTMDTAGTLMDGRRFWALANTGRVADAGTNDKLRQFVLLMTAADGTLATTAKNTAIRVVCNNTLTSALASGKAEFKVNHRSRFVATAAKAALGFTLQDGADGFDAMVARLTAMNTVLVNEEEAKAFFVSLVRPPKPEEVKATENLMDKDGFAALLAMPSISELSDDDRSPRGLDDLMDAYVHAPGAMPGTARGLVEAATYYIDHVRGTDTDKRMASAWTGQGDTFKTTAYNRAGSLAGVLDLPAFAA